MTSSRSSGLVLDDDEDDDDSDDDDGDDVTDRRFEATRFDVNN